MHGAKNCVDRGGDMLEINDESADTKMDIGPITLQHMDSHHGTNQSFVDRGDILQIKEESADTKMDIGPTTLQYPDSYYRTHQDCVDRGDMLQMKEESADTKMDIGPITLQPTDSHYRTNQMPITNAEKQKRYRERMRSQNPEKFNETKKKNAERNRKRRKINEYSEEDKDIQRRIWRNRKKSKRNNPNDNTAQQNHNKTNTENMPMTAAEKQKRYRERMRSQNPEKFKEAKEKNAERNWKRRKINKYSEEDKDIQRKMCRNRKKSKKNNPNDNTAQPNHNRTNTENDCVDLGGDMLQIKEESADIKMDIGPTTVQHMNSHYRTVQRRTNAVRPESATDNSNIDTFPSSGVKQSSNELKLKRLDWRPSVSTKSLAAAGIRIIVEGSRLVIVPAVLQHETNQQNVSVAKTKKAFSNDPVNISVVKTKNTVGSDPVNISVAKKKKKIFNDPVNISVVKTENTIGNDPANISVVKTENTIDNDTELCSEEEEETFEECEDTDIEIYICDYCLLTFCSKATIVNHMNSEHITRIPRCNICDKSFKHKRYLKIHKSSMHTPLMKECNECGKFVVPSNLKKHMVSAHSVKKWHCRICSKIMESSLDLHCHLNNVHGQKQSTDSSLVNTCQYCQNIYVDQIDLIGHIKRVHGPPFLGCPNCNASYNKEDHLRRHITSVHSRRAGAEPNLYICDYCQKSFIKKFDIIDHLTSVHASVSYKCNLCDKSFMCEKYLQTHTLSTHTDKGLKCMICGEMVVSKQKLLVHLNNVHRQESIDSPFLNRCGGFQKIYTGRKNLTPRIRNMNGTSCHRCIECTASFMSEASLQIHMKVVHSKEKLQENSQQSMERSASKHPPVGSVNAVVSANTPQPAHKEMKLCSVVLHRMDFQLPAVQKEPLLD